MLNVQSYNYGAICTKGLNLVLNPDRCYVCENGTICYTFKPKLELAALQ